MYQELLANLTQGLQWVAIQPPCSENEIAQTEEAVGHPFPSELKSLLRELNGDNWLLLSAEQMKHTVQLNRTCWLPILDSKEAYLDRVERFIFFATNGCGDYYCYRVNSDGIPDESSIYLWEHESVFEECCWKKVASNMEELITRYYHDEI